MKAEHLAVVGGFSGAVGIVVERVTEKAMSANPQSAPSLNLRLVQGGIGVLAVAIGYFTDFDGVSDGIEAFGVGYIVGAAT